MGLFRKLIDSEYKELKRFEVLANEVVALEETMSKLSDEELLILEKDWQMEKL